MARVIGSVSRGGRRGSTLTMGRRRPAWERAEAQNAMYVAPWLLLIWAAICGQLAHILFVTDATFQFLVIAGIVIGTGWLCWAGFVSTRERSKVALIHTIVTVILSGAWMVVCTVVGFVGFEPVSWFPFEVPLPQRPTIDLWLIGGGTLAVMWNMRQGLRVSEARHAAMTEEEEDEWTQAGFPGVKGKVKRRNEFRSEGMFILPRGMTVEQLQKGARNIESAFDWPINSLTMIPYGGASRKVKAVVTHKNPLEGNLEWPGIER
jgi:hypothetical protein